MYTDSFIKSFNRHYRVVLDGHYTSFSEVWDVVCSRSSIPVSCKRLVFDRFVNRALSMPTDSACFTLNGLRFQVWSR